MKKVFTQMLIPKKVGFLPRLGGICLFLFASFLVQAQERAKDESGQSFQEASVLVRSTSNGVASNTDGKLSTHLIIIKSELR